MNRFFNTFIVLFACIASDCQKDKTNTVAQPNRVRYKPDQFVMGIDMSYVNQLQDYGATYRDSSRVKDPFVLLRDRGANLVRVRLWHTPKWTAALNNGRMYSDLADVSKTIQRAKDAGMQVNLDIHYSDEWADPNKQPIPAAWANLPFHVLKDSVYQYTLNVLNYLKIRNLTPEMVQVGNENNNGMLAPLGSVSNNNFQAFGALLASGIKAVRDFSATSAIKPKIVLHVAQLHHADWWADGVINKAGVTDFDILGISHYYQWAQLKTMAEIGETIKKLRAKYGKQIMVVETAYSWTTEDADNYTNIMSSATAVPAYPVSKEGQLKYLQDFTQTIIANGATGIQYWEPAWISSPMRDPWGQGSSWDNNTLFDFSGNALIGADFMTHKYVF